MIDLKNIQRLKLLKILLIGDSCVDYYHYGSCDRMSPEAPVPILNYLYTEEYPGMAANVLANLNGLGISCDFKTNHHTIKKERYVDQKSRQQFLRVDTGDDVDSSGANIDDFDLESYDAIVISDYDKGYVTYDFAKELTSRFGGLIFVDSKKKDLSCFENCLIKINQSENYNAYKFPKDYQLVVTLGERGARWLDRTYDTETVDVFDVSGVGDSFFAGLIVGYLIDIDMETAIQFANHCAKIAVQKMGTYAVTLGEVFE